MKVTWNAAAFAVGALIWGNTVIAQNTAALDSPPQEPQTSQPASGVDTQLQGTTPRIDGAIQGDANVNGNLDSHNDSRRLNNEHNQNGGFGAGASVHGRGALGVGFRTDGDLTISSVAPGSPAARMGLQPGDRIVSVNGRTYDNTRAFIDAAGQIPLNQEAEVVYVRGGVQHRAMARFAPWDSVYSPDYGRSHSTMRPSFDEGVDPNAVLPGEFHPGYGGPQYAPYGAANCPCGSFQSYQSVPSYRCWGRRRCRCRC